MLLKTLKKLLGLKVGDSINIDVKDLFNDNHDLTQVLGISNDRAKDIDIEVNLNLGSANFTVYTCDFTHDYIDINADYRN